MEHSQVNTSINKPQDTQGASPSAEFDQFAVDYNAGMENSVKKLVGDNPDIFIEVLDCCVLGGKRQTVTLP